MALSELLHAARVGDKECRKDILFNLYHPYIKDPFMFSIEYLEESKFLIQGKKVS